MARNAAELEAVGAGFELDFRVYFARKANKALALVAAARELGLGVDLASERELRQVLALGVEPADLVMTAAVKPAALLELCLESGTTVIADNDDELRLLAEIARRSGRRTPVALRLAPRAREEKPETRFGFSHAEAIDAAERHLPVTGEAGPGVAGVHFHLDGYAANDRVAAIAEAIELIDALRERGHEPAFLDIGGGIPMSYLESGAEWKDFWVEAPARTARRWRLADLRSPRPRPESARRRGDRRGQRLPLLSAARRRSVARAGSRLRAGRRRTQAPRSPRRSAHADFSFAASPGAPSSTAAA